MHNKKYASRQAKTTDNLEQGSDQETSSANVKVYQVDLPNQPLIDLAWMQLPIRKSFG